MHTVKKCLVSACLTGLCTRYDGCIKYSKPCMEALAPYHWIPVCPEQLGGLPTPRPPADLCGGDGFQVLDGRARVLTRDGEDLTEAFVRGARQVLLLAEMLNINLAFLKKGSPSCGTTPLAGVTTALLERHGITIREF
ncbi:DUF523 domain-containing protein [Desulfolithobacter sp.]